MLQVIQYQKNGNIIVDELSAPKCPENGILVRNLASVISAGTEKTSITNAKSSLLERARKQPKEVQMVMNFIKKEGIISTAQRVFAKLDSYKTLGYSSAGIVIESKTEEFLPGDYVACGGAGYALHAEIIAVPKNLAVKVPKNILPEFAAYATVGAIALQGIRQADVRLGDNVAVIGLGLLGQITVQMLKAAGCNVAGLDIDESLFDLASKSGTKQNYVSSMDNLPSLLAFTNGIGFDAVIITAGTTSNDPMNLAIHMARKKARVIVVGDIGMNLPRSPFYQKELEISISCSYGPGRYDSIYEEQGIDYPPAFVRWTENRNMQAVINMINGGSLDLSIITTHKFLINDAANAYDIISGKTKEPYLGIVLEYPDRKDKAFANKYENQERTKIDSVTVGFIGAGSFAQNYLLKPLAESGVILHTVTTASSVNAMTVGKRFGFLNSSTDSDSVIDNPEINAIFCASRHDSHAKYVINSLKQNKSIFVEKPLAVNLEQLHAIDESLANSSGQIMVGFNRRFSKSFEDIKSFFAKRSEPMTISYRINAGMPPRDFWVFAPEQGGGRIIGEVCHFIDCMCYLTDSVPVKVFAECISSQNKMTFNHDNVVISLKFADGSIGSIQYFANGDSALEKELCEVFCEGSSAVMNNFHSTSFYRNSGLSHKKYDGKKGHAKQIQATVNAIKNGSPMPIDYKTIRQVTIATFAAVESLHKGYAVEIDN